jgi:pimeloyl-ACP methyl ester carboxylesterase
VRPRILVPLLAAAVLLVAVPAAAQASGHKPTIVLVHGAFADASGWSGEITRLEKQGYAVVAPANPLRGVASDAAYLRTFLSTVSGPIVLVGHSYGGFVITNAATGNPNVKALVYVAGYAPAEGDTVASLGSLGTGGRIGPETLYIKPFPLPDGSQGLEGYIKPALFEQIFAADVPRKLAGAMALSQRPASLAALGEPSGPPAWASIPSWFLIPTADHAIGTDVLNAMAARIHPRKIITVKGASHAVLVSRPGVTAKLILRAARAVR